MKKSLSLLLAIAMVFSMFASVAVAEEVTTVQLDAAAKFEALKELGIFEGDAGSGDAALNREMTRAEAAVIISKLFDLDISNPPAKPSFTDVDAGHWAYAYIEAAAAAGIINGRTNGEFDPGTEAEVAAGVGHVTVQELAVMLTLGLEYATDLTIDHNATINGAAPWAQPYVAAAVKWGIISSQSDYTKKAIREQLVEAAYEVLKVLEAESLKVEAVVVVDENNLDVTFTDGETVRVELAEALEPNVAQTVTFTYKGKEFTQSVTLEAEEATIAIQEAKALTEKVIEVKLIQPVSNPKISDFLVVTVDGVKTENDSVIEIEEAVLAPHDADNKTVYLFTAGLEPGAHYTVSTELGTKADFVGVNRDKGTEPVFTARADGHKAVEIEFGEPVLVDSDNTYTVKVYNSNRELEVSEVKIQQQKVVLSVEEMRAADLYEVIINGTYTDLEGIAGTQDSYVFQGADINDTKYQVHAANLVADDILIVEVNTNTNRTVNDWDQILNSDNYVVETAFGSERFGIKEVKQVNSDNGRVALFLDAETEEGELYKVTIRNMKTRNGFGVADEPLNSSYFYGLPEDKEKLNLNIVPGKVGETLHFSEGVPTILRVTFDDLLDEDFARNKANYKLVNLSKNEEVEIVRVELSDNDITKHTLGRVLLHLPEELDETDVYELSVSNLRDNDGNGLGDYDSIVFTRDQTTGQNKTQDAIEKIEKIDYEKRDDGHHQIKITFNAQVSAAEAVNFKNYYIEGLGYPYFIHDNSENNTVVTMYIPEPKQGEIYTVTATNMVNRHGVSMKGSKIEGQFAAKAGASEGVKPSFVAARIIDRQTVALYFDTDVKGSQFASFYNDRHELIANVYTYVRGNQSGRTPVNYNSNFGGKVYFDPSNENVLYVRTGIVDKKGAFESGHRVISIEQPGFLHENSATTQEFAGVGVNPIAPNVLRVIAVDNKTITVTFNGPITTPNPDHYWIEDPKENAINLSKVVKVSDLVYQFVIEDGQSLTTGIHKLSVLGENLVDSTGYVSAGEKDSGTTITREFAGRTNAPGTIKDLSVIVLDKYTFQVRYPEAMAANVTDATYYELYKQGTETNPVADGSNFVVTYNEDTRVATVHSSKSLYDSSNLILDLRISDELTNALGTRSIDPEYKGRFVSRSNDPATPKLTIKSAEVDNGNNYTVVVELDRPIAFDLADPIAFRDPLSTDDKSSYHKQFNLDFVKDRKDGSSRNPVSAVLSNDGLTITITGNNGGLEDYAYYAIILKGFDAKYDNKGNLEHSGNKMYHKYSNEEIKKEIVVEGTVVFNRK